MRLLSRLLRSFITEGTLKLYDAHGKLRTFGSGTEPFSTARLHDTSLHGKLFRNPELYAAEAYMDETLTFEDGTDLRDFLYLFSINRAGLSADPLQKALRSMWRRMRVLHHHNPIGKAAENAKHHYNISTDLYRLFLDRDLSYTCAFYEDPEKDTLEQAQENKLRRITAKMRLEPGMRVAELGCGWGAAAIYMAKNTGARITALNVSDEQLATARRNAEAAGVSHLVDFQERDYRELEGKYDRVVSIGMLEHVGPAHYGELLNLIRTHLNPGGYAFLHSIGRVGPPGATAPFIRKYIFPGAYAPSISEMFQATELASMWVADVEILRLHYHYTLKHWRERFMENWDKAAALYDERFCRMWEFYLVSMEMAFQHGGQLIFQLLLSEKRDDVPIVRDYMVDDARALAKAGRASTGGTKKSPQKQARRAGASRQSGRKAGGGKAQQKRAGGKTARGRG